MELFFDVGSPYAWLAAERVESILGPVTWRPVLLGGIFAAVGRSSWARTDARGAGVAEIERRAAERGLPPVRWPERWPNDGLRAMRVAAWVDLTAPPEHDAVRAFALAALRTHFVARRSETSTHERHLRSKKMGEVMRQSTSRSDVAGGRQGARDAVNVRVLLTLGLVVAALCTGVSWVRSTGADAAGARAGGTSSRATVKVTAGPLTASLVLRRKGASMCGSLQAETRVSADQIVGPDPQRACISSRNRTSFSEVLASCPGGLAATFALPPGERRAWLRSAEGSLRLPVRTVRIGGTLVRVAIAAVPARATEVGIAFQARGPADVPVGDVAGLCD
ncbi:DsbA family protein [Patulibacter sp. NPDC049589]|uniref:DsbA family protein n=1 Tax=Patulibacter sp. NPDC049589 TaxID=3154731 RepID=UPI00341F0307